ncbi:GGDEF domain-containing protein [Blastococcus capsensis]|uniref:GGDEF domain-containing protein n=1 Tax=Blastococcus capsensis TaxID=1564163 RepID=UPI0025416102|nr:GGDEF domain-containing protein [Blastococcus capsensis]MDK3258929.1 GGDEF domain-containing protein [Blastococcus capsensis]
MFLVSAVALAAWTVVDLARVSHQATVSSWSVVPVLVVAAWMYHAVPADRLDRTGAYTHTALLGILLICALRVVTDDSSIGAHAFLTLPVLWAANHLQRGGVVLVTATALVADALTLSLLLPVETALADFFFSGAVLVVVAFVLHRAATAQAGLVQALQEQADVDSLTGLVNRRVFGRALRRSAHRNGAALVLIDVDGFKMINDAHGHPAGDEVLVHLAAVLREQVRSDDAVVFRLGGDELAVLLPGCTGEVAARRAEVLLDAVRGSTVPLSGGGHLQLSVSVGVAHLPGEVGDLRALYSAADTALYDAKRAGRGRVALALA